MHLKYIHKITCKSFTNHYFKPTIHRLRKKEGSTCTIPQKYIPKTTFSYAPFSISSLVEEPEDNLKCFQRVDVNPKGWVNPFVDYEINSGPYSAFYKMKYNTIKEKITECFPHSTAKYYFRTLLSVLGG